jgi:hypothetical protein
MIANTLRVARVRSSIIVVLLEPIADNRTCEEIMQRCITLQVVDLLIRAAWNERYSPKHAAVLDVRVLLSEDIRDWYALENDIQEAAYDIFQEVVELKSPNVILPLQSQTRTARYACKQFCSRYRETVKFDKFQVRGKDTIVVRDSHPTRYLNHEKTAQNGCDFAESLLLAFRALSILLRHNKYLPTNQSGSTTVRSLYSQIGFPQLVVCGDQSRG